MNENLVNNSGQGPNTPVIDLVAKKFNWGAFLFTWIWGCFNGSFITFIALAVAIFIGWIPVIGILAILGVQIWIGINGNKWAWQNKKWDSIEQFHNIQKKWAIAGLILSIIHIILIITMVFHMHGLMNNMNNTVKLQNSTMTKKAVNLAMEAVEMNKALGEKCEFSSEGLAACFKNRISGQKEGNIITLKDLSRWEFNGDGICRSKGDCTIKVYYKTESEPMITIPLYATKKGNLKIKSEDVQEYLSY